MAKPKNGIEERISESDPRWIETKELLEKTLEKSIQRHSVRACKSCGSFAQMKPHQNFCSTVCKSLYHNTKKQLALETAQARIKQLELENAELRQRLGEAV